MATPIPENTSLPTPARRDAESAWRQLHYFNLYRITLSALFVSSVYLKGNLPLLGKSDPQLFETISLAYLIIGICASFIIQGRKFKFKLIVYSLAIIDIIGLTLLMRASGGIETGLGMLLVVAIAGNSILVNSITSSLFAAIAALAVLAEQVFAHLAPDLAPNYTHAGILGAALFATAFLAYVLSSRIRDSEALAAQRGVDLANLAQLNQHVLQRMQSGIIVVDENQRIRLMNESAWHMLSLAGPDTSNTYDLRAISSELAGQLENWRMNKHTEARMFKSAHGSGELLPSMTSLGSDARAGTLIFLEDTTRMAQQAQQIKLASLGRLTASIAHEIRNPLGAISHAEQLLSEADSYNTADKRLLEIINTNTSRVNGIIENVLQLSRRDTSAPTDFSLKPWLGQFVTELCQNGDCEESDILIDIQPQNCRVHMDTSQLHQVLWNLCTNGLRYSLDHPRLELRGGLMPNSSKPFLDIIDHGPGIDSDAQQHIFEPFYTTENKGSGLGLYIARELCLCNQARLSYHSGPAANSCFHIEFAPSQT